MSRQWNPFKETKSPQQNIHGDREELPKMHLLFSEIDRWEYDSINKIRQVAAITRNELQKLLSIPVAQMSTGANIPSEGYEPQGCVSSNEESLFKPRKELEEALHIDLIPDHDRTPIYFIKLKVTNEDVVTLQSDRTSRQLSDSFKDIDLLSKKLLASSLNFSDLRKDLSEFKSEDPLDPINKDNLILLQISSPEKSQLSASLQQLTGNRLSILNKPSALLIQLKQPIQSTIVIDMFNKSWKDLDQLLNEISQLKHIHSVYIRGTPPEDENDRQYFFSKYPIIKAIFENEQSLIVQWAMDTANEYKKIGDMYIKKGEKEKAHFHFSQGVTLYKRLSAFLKERKQLK